MWYMTSSPPRDSCWLCQLRDRVNDADLCEECTTMLRGEDRVVPQPHSHRTDKEKAID